MNRYTQSLSNQGIYFAGDLFQCVITFKVIKKQALFNESSSATQSAVQSQSPSKRTSGFFSTKELDTINAKSITQDDLDKHLALKLQDLDLKSNRNEEAIITQSDRKERPQRSITSSRTLGPHRSTKIRLSSSQSSLTLNQTSLDKANQLENNRSNQSNLLSIGYHKQHSFNSTSLMGQESSDRLFRSVASTATSNESIRSSSIKETAYILYAFAQVSGQLFTDPSLVKVPSFAEDSKVTFNSVAYGGHGLLANSQKHRNNNYYGLKSDSQNVTKEFPVLTTPSVVICSDMNLGFENSHSCTFTFKFLI